MNSFSRILLGVSAIFAATAMAELKYTVAPKFFEEKFEGKNLGPCHGGVVVDKAGQAYVTTDDAAKGIVVYSPQGKFVRSFGPSHIHGLEIRDEQGTEYIYGARHAHSEVVKLKLDGTQVWSLGYPKESGLYPDAKGFKPCAVTVAPDGSIFVADGYGSHHVLKFDKDRKFVKAFGGFGMQEGKFNTCHGIAFDGRGSKPLLLVANRNNDRVEHWDLDGNFVKVIQKGLRMPAAVQIQGDYAVLPELKGRVTLLDKDGNIAAQLGDNPDLTQHANYGLPPEKFQDGACASPHGAFMDKDGNVIVAEWSLTGHMHKFLKQK